MSRGGVNKVILIGNLGSDPEVKYTPSGVPVANFSLATTESWSDKTSGERQERTEWHRLVLWRRLAEIAGQYLKKGSKLYVEGKLQTRSWDDQNGQKRYTTEVVVNDMQMLDSRGDSGGVGGVAILVQPPWKRGRLSLRSRKKTISLFEPGRLLRVHTEIRSAVRERARRGMDHYPACCCARSQSRSPCSKPRWEFSYRLLMKA